MRSVSCGSCGLVGWAESGNCKRCGQPFQVNQQTPRVSTPPQDYSAGYDYNYARTPGDFDAATKKRKGYAVASLVIGILGFFTFGILFIGTVIGTSLGIAALTKHNKQPNVYGGKGLAITGIVLNLAALCMIVPLGIISAIAIPNLLASRRAANEASAISTLRKIGMAEATYASTVGQGGYGNLTQLVNAGMLDATMSVGTRNGYAFTITAVGGNFEVRAMPLTPGHGNRSFYTCASDGGEIHVGVGGMPADASSPTLDSTYGPQQRRTASKPELEGPVSISTR